MNTQKPFLLLCLMLEVANLPANTYQPINTEQNELNLNYAYGSSAILIAAGIALGLNSNRIAQIIKKSANKKSAAHKIKIAAAGLTAFGIAAIFRTIGYHRKSLAKKHNVPEDPDTARLSIERPKNQSSLAINETRRPFIPKTPALLETPQPTPVRADLQLTPPTPPQNTSSPSENGEHIPLNTATLRSNTCLAIMLRAVKAATVEGEIARAEIDEALNPLTNGLSSEEIKYLLEGSGAIQIGFGSWLVSSQCEGLVSRMNGLITDKDELGVEFIYNSDEAKLIQSINASCNRRTGGLLPQAITSFNGADKLTLLSVLSFKAPWYYKFKQPATKAIFTNDDGSKQEILLMKQINPYLYYENEKGKFLYAKYNPDDTVETKDDHDDQLRTASPQEIAALREDIQKNLKKINSLQQAIEQAQKSNQTQAAIDKLQTQLTRAEVLLSVSRNELKAFEELGKRATTCSATGNKIDYNREYGIMFVLKSDASTKIDLNEALKEVIAKGKIERVEFGLPKGKIELPETDIAELIKSLGPEAIFKEGGLSALDKKIFVNKVIAKGHVEFDDNGTKAVMQTSAQFAYRGFLPHEPAHKQFILDKSFGFSIVAQNTTDSRAISLFSGEVTNANQVKPIA
jgi:hypothetical protein